MGKRTNDIKGIFWHAVEQTDLSERAAYLERACKGDAQVRAQIEELLCAHEAAEGFLTIPILEAQSVLDEPPICEGPGTVIGRYKLLERIGEGGMAVVYMAEQERPVRRKVALKIIKPGMDTKQVIARFEGERQALAMMDHANIAKVFDGGATETGRPYFVMELVRGIPITEYCDLNGLGTRERLSLFAQVCQAVQHAHQKGIIHRDIKPSNVLVTRQDGQAIPKVIDFGIAKATEQRLTEKTLFTRYSQIIGTPAYMSPEQAEFGDSDADTRTDIYSLGVLLYELLTGTTPFSEEELRRAGYVGMQRVIREEEPTKPSTRLTTLGDTLHAVAKQRSSTADQLKRALRGDLDWIVMKALEKDRKRRYDTVSIFADDVQRHLNREPVSAGPPTTFYRVKKFIQRRRGLVTTTVAVVAAVLVGLVASVSMYIRADRALQRESVARSETQLVSDFFTEGLLASMFPENIKGQDVTVRYLLDEAAKNIDRRLEGSPLSEAKVRETIGLAYQKLGAYDSAESHLERALEIRLKHLGEADSSTLRSLSQIGRLYIYQQRYGEAETVLRNAVAMKKQVLGEDHPDTLEAMLWLGQLYAYRSNFRDGHPLLTQVEDVGRRVLGVEHPTVLGAMLCRTYLYTYGFQKKQANLMASKGLEISRRALGEEHETTLDFMNMLANSYMDLRECDKAVDLFGRALETSQRVLGPDHPLTIDIMSRLGHVYIVEGQFEQASPLVIKAAERARRMLGWGHIWTLLCAMRVVRLYEEQGQYENMEAVLTEALEKGCPLQGNPELTGWFHWKLHQHVASLSGVARDHYDRAEYDTTIGTLVRQQELRRYLSAREGRTPPSDVALLTMTLWRLGRAEDAKTELHRLRQMYEQGNYTYQRRYLYEVERAFLGERSGFCHAWDCIENENLEEASMVIEELQDNPLADNPYNCLDGLAGALVRAYCIQGQRAEGQGRYAKAIDAYESALRVDAESARAHNRLACLLGTCHAGMVRDGAGAVEHAVLACELTQWTRADYLTTLAAAHAECGDFDKAVKCQTEAINLLGQEDAKDMRGYYQAQLQSYRAGKPCHRSLVACWSFEQSNDKQVLDSSGNGLHGNLVVCIRINRT